MTKTRLAKLVSNNLFERGWGAGVGWPTARPPGCFCTDVMKTNADLSKFAKICCPLSLSQDYTSDWLILSVPFLILKVVKVNFVTYTVHRDSTWSSKAHTPIVDDTRSKRRPDVISQTHYWLGLYVLQNLSEKKLWYHAQPFGCTQQAPQPKPLHHARQLSLTFGLSCMCPKSSTMIPSVEYHLHDIVCSIGQKPSSTEYVCCFVLFEPIFLSFFLGWRIPNSIIRLSGLWAPN